MNVNLFIQGKGGIGGRILRATIRVKDSDRGKSSLGKLTGEGSWPVGATHRLLVSGPWGPLPGEDIGSQGSLKLDSPVLENLSEEPPALQISQQGHNAKTLAEWAAGLGHPPYIRSSQNGAMISEKELVL